MTADQAARQCIVDQAQKIEQLMKLRHESPDDIDDGLRELDIEYAAHRAEIVARAVWS